jgi:hypothetical protein
LSPVRRGDTELLANDDLVVAKVLLVQIIVG